MATTDELARALGFNTSTTPDRHMWGTVSAVNPDGSLSVYLAGAKAPARVVPICQATAGDRVLCVVFGGSIVALGVVQSG